MYLRGQSAISQVSRLDEVGLHDPEDEGVYGGAKSGGPSLWLPLRDLPPSLCLESVLHYAEVAAAAAHWGLFPTLNHSLKAQRGDEFGYALQTSCFSGPAASSAGKREAQRGGREAPAGKVGRARGKPGGKCLSNFTAQAAYEVASVRGLHSRVCLWEACRGVATCQCQ